jgi:hypothetical protein
MYPRIKKVFIRATQDQVEIQRWYEESQARRGDEIAYELRREVDWSSRFATRGLETSYNGKFSSDGGILGVDFNWAKSVKKALEKKIIPKGFQKKKRRMIVNEEIITSQINAETGNAFIPWCNGQVIRGHGMGILVKFDGFRYLQAGSSKNYTVRPV